MANFQYSTDIKAYVLEKAGETTDGTSDYDSLVRIDINRALMAMCMGGCEFAPTIQEDWWWLRKDPPGILTLEPPYDTGSVTVANGSTSASFSDAPAASLTGYFFKTDGDVFRISSHLAGQTGFSLDSVYTGESGTKTFRAFKTEYPLATDCLRIIGPMYGHMDGYFDVQGIAIQAMNRDYPVAMTEVGRPDRFAQINDSKVRFNRCGLDTGGSLIRLEYEYMYRPADLVFGDSEEPAVPRNYRYLLAEMALFWLYLTKDDNRDEKLALICARGMEAMVQEHRQRQVVHGTQLGRIFSRPSSRDTRKVLRTESGVIIG